MKDAKEALKRAIRDEIGGKKLFDNDISESVIKIAMVKAQASEAEVRAAYQDAKSEVVAEKFEERNNSYGEDN